VTGAKGSMDRSARTGPGHRSTRWWFAAILLLLVFFAQLAFGARQLSLTSDEPAHLGAGYTYLVTGDTWTVPSRGHPPLINAWTALPVVLGNPHIPVQTLPNWHAIALPPYFRALLPLLGPVERLEVAGRVPVMLLGVLLGGLVFRWAADLFGYKGGLLALVLMTFDPTMVAHAQLATTDLGVTLLGFATFFVGWRWMRANRAPAPDLRWAVALGLLSGATLAAKVSGLMWVGLAVGFTSLVQIVRLSAQKPGLNGQKPGLWRCTIARKTWFLVHGERGGKTWFLMRQVLIITIVALLFLCALYRFELGPLSIGSHVLTVPASHHWEALVRQFTSPSGRLMFLAGETRLGEGWWWYFPFAFLVKNPVPLLVAWIGACVLLLCRRSLTPVDLLFLLGFPVVYVALAIYSEMNIGYRHLLPIHPFLYVFAAQWAGKAQKPGFFRKTWFLCAHWTGRAKKPDLTVSLKGKTWFLRLLWVGLLIWYVVGTLRISPHYLAYFNELVGGPRNGYRYLVDSNLDWGQGFKALKEELDRLGIQPPIRLAHTWYAGPELYGVQYEPIPPFGDDFSVAFSPRFDPSPGTYVLGATLLQRGSGDLEQYEWFRHRTPVAQPGYALFVYRVDPPEPPATWIAQCVKPAAPLDDELIAREFHTQPLRRVYFDCTQSWVYPEDGRTSGWYALHEQALRADDLPIRPHLDQAQLSYEHHHYDGMAPAFSLYEYSPAMQDIAYVSGVRVAALGMSPEQVAAQRPVVDAPLHLDGPLDFLGYRVVEASPEAVAVETWWQVADRVHPDADRVHPETYDSPARPLSIMAHLVDGAGNPVGVADGLGVPMEVWQAGDVLVQYHRFLLTPEQWKSSAPLPVSGREGLWLQTGVYWLDTLERQTVNGPGPNTGDHILIGEIRLTDEPID